MLMLKFFLFSLLWTLTGNPILAIILIIIIYYAIDRRYIGLLPSIFKPFKTLSRISNLRRILTLNPHDMSTRYELAHLYLERRQFKTSLALLEDLSISMQSEPYVIADLGICNLALGRLEIGEEMVVRAMSLDKNTQYGEPYLRLATALASVDATKALGYLSRFQSQNSSSCESFYRLGVLHKQLGDDTKAKEAFRQCRQTFRMLPRFRKRKERRWVILALFKLAF